MHRFIRWYNQNREVFFIIVVIIAFIIIMIQVVNGIFAEENAQKRNEIASENSGTNSSTTISTPSTSVITGEEISQTQSNILVNVIEEFVEYCNAGEIESAYNMLTDECKELIYPTLEYFNQNYYQKIFYIDRMYSLENWYNEGNFYTYYIKYTEDVLASGNLNSEDNKGDYITVVKEGTNYKLNISSYIGREIINKQEARNAFSITVNWLDMYMDYTIANITVKNNTSDMICLDTKEDNTTMYLYDENDVTYSSLLNEIADEQLIIRANMSNTLNIKFNKIYNPERVLSGIVFSDIVLDYEEYLTGNSEKNPVTINLKIY